MSSKLIALVGGVAPGFAWAQAASPVCTALDGPVCGLVQELVPRLNQRVGAVLLDEGSSRAAFRPSRVYASLLAVEQAAVAGGCVIDGFATGEYDVGASSRSWDGLVVREGADHEAGGACGVAPSTWTGTATSASATLALGDAVGVHEPTGKLAANLDERGFMAGHWLRRVGDRGVFVALTGSCPVDRDAGVVLDAWYPGPLAPFEPPLRFAVIGDGGDGSAGQLAVADALAGVCSARRCDFVLSAGDNIYDVGVTSPTDPQFSTKFELPYAGLDVPFHMVLGNHDYGNAYDTARAAHQVAYTAHSTRWSMPAPYYAFHAGGVQFVALDTTAILQGDGAPQRAFTRAALTEPARWRIAFGHHPYKSNGRHGNAGSFDGQSDPVRRGAHWKSFFEQELCDRVDVYFAGHDHDRQWLGEVCGTELVVSGAAAKSRSLVGSNPTLFQSPDLGFLYVVIDGDTLTGSFYGTDGQVDFERSIQRP